MTGRRRRLAFALALLGLANAGTEVAGAQDWPPPRDPAGRVRAESLATAPTAASPRRGPPPPAIRPPLEMRAGDRPSFFRTSVGAAAFGDEARLAVALIDGSVGRWTLRGPLVGVTYAADRGHGGAVGAGTLALAGTAALVAFGLVDATRDGLAAIGPLAVAFPVLWLTNFQAERGLAGPRRNRDVRSRAFGAFVESRTDLFFRRGRHSFVRAEPGAGLSLTLPVGREVRRTGHDLVLHAGLAAHLDWYPGHGTVRRHGRPYAEVILSRPHGH